MSITTDPAREFTDLCTILRESTTEQGSDFLAGKFSVESWSTDFMLILSTIHQRISALREMIEQTDLDDDIKQEAFSCLNRIRLSFSLSGLSNQWAHSVSQYLIDENIRTIRMASAYVRPKHGYTAPEGEELAELLKMIDELLGWLNKHELSERDFIRTAIIEGLTAFQFRITRVGWFGWPDTFDSLKAVVGAYLALEQGMPEANTSPPYELMVKKTGDLLKTFFDKIKFAKDIQETGDWLLRGYGAIHLATSSQPIVSGLLTHAV